MHEPIIDRETFEKVQKALLDRDVKANQDGTLSIYAGHLKCADCKMSMTKRVGSKYKRKTKTTLSLCLFNLLQEIKKIYALNT